MSTKDGFDASFFMEPQADTLAELDALVVSLPPARLTSHYQTAGLEAEIGGSPVLSASVHSTKAYHRGRQESSSSEVANITFRHNGNEYQITSQYGEADEAEQAERQQAAEPFLQVASMLPRAEAAWTSEVWDAIVDHEAELRLYAGKLLATCPQPVSRWQERSDIHYFWDGSEIGLNLWLPYQFGGAVTSLKQAIGWQTLINAADGTSYSYSFHPDYEVEAELEIGKSMPPTPDDVMDVMTDEAYEAWQQALDQHLDSRSTAREMGIYKPTDGAMQQLVKAFKTAVAAGLMELKTDAED